MMFLPFEENDWALMPWAARRALDFAGLKMSLAEWRAMSEPDRHRLARLGLDAAVDKDAVRVLAHTATAIDAFIPPGGPPAEISIDREAWSALSCVARHALHAYARRGKRERLRAAYESLMSSGESQSTR